LKVEQTLIAQGPVDVNVSRLPRELPEELAAATNGGYEDWALAEKEARVELEQECNDLREENDMLRQINSDLGAEAEAAEVLLKRWVTFFDTATRSEPFKCIAEDSRRWIKTANAEVSGDGTASAGLPG
jgi:hypothetical protein